MRFFLVALPLLLIGCGPDVSVSKVAIDADNDGYDQEVDCDDGQATVNPEAAEVCDGLDNDCDGTADDAAVDASSWHPDADGDLYGDGGSTAAACTAPGGYVADGTDCDDEDARVHPGATEDDCTDPNDYNCDGSTEFADVDQDGVVACEDCNDAEAAIHPSAIEACNGVDDDCDALIDDADDSVDPATQLTWYADADADGFGDPARPRLACVQPSGFVVESADCDDTSADVSPAAAEVCDAIDDDCDGLVDDDDPDLDASTAATWYSDLDGDTYGAGAGTALCVGPAGASATGDDCDDGSVLFHPGAPETDCADPLDYNCDGSTGYADADGDGTAACEDCDDADAERSPSLSEICDESNRDEDCDGDSDDADTSTAASSMTTFYRDVDGDGYSDSAGLSVAQCEQPTSYSSVTGDCDDYDGTVNPGATELCDALDVDEDCDGSADDDDVSTDASSYVAYYADADGDGFGDPTRNARQCESPSGYVSNDEDCGDDDAAVNPSATEVCDAFDNDEDCDGLSEDADSDSTGQSTWYGDGDGDGFGDDADTVDACSQPTGYAAAGGDCDDDDAAYNPAEIESDCTDLSDYNCDGVSEYADADGDGWTGCEDCDDGDADTFPGAASNDSALACMNDDDGDNWGDAAVASGVTAGSDCDDTDLMVRPGAAEVCDNGVDDDCDGGTGACRPASGSLSTAVQYWGEAAAGDGAGYPVSGVGDVDGDGQDDILIGAGGNDDGGSNAGAAYLVLGSPSPTSASLTTAVEFSGEAVSDAAGRATSGAGDVNGDGYGDLLIGAYGNDDGGNYAGAAYLVLGGPSPSSLGLSTAIEYWGEAAGDFAAAVSGAGDVDGDGYDDILVGAYGSDAGGTNSGAAYLVLGRASPSSASLSAALEYRGESVDDYAGYSACGAGDVDGDGLADLLIGAGGDDDGGIFAGAAYLVLGSASPASVSLSAAVKYRGEVAGDGAGSAVSQAGDIDGDGYGDMLIRASGSDDGGADAGAAYLVLGGATPASASLSAVVEYWGESAGDSAGVSISGAGDIDVDGFDDILVGASGNDDGGLNAGAVYLVYGSSSPASASLSTAIEYWGEAASDYSGVSVSAAGDVDADGYPDIIVGSSGNDDAGVDAGAGYLLLGVGP